MARYIFNVIDGSSLVDDTGSECADMADMRPQAIEAAWQDCMIYLAISLRVANGKCM